MNWRAIGSVVVLALSLLVGSACNPLAAKPSATSSPTPTPSPSPVASAAIPADFPSDFPIYPGARLTEAARFATSDATDFAMEWQTTDRLSKVQTFFFAQLHSGDWTLLNTSGNVNTSFSATFKRKSNPKVTGTVGLAAGAGVTTITVVLAS